MSLQVWLPLNGNLNNNGLHQYSLSMFRGTETYHTNGKIGSCFHANGVNTIKILNFLPDFYNYTGYSLCAWFYIEAQNPSHTGSAIISAGNWNNQLLNLAVSNWSTDHYTYLRVSGPNWTKFYSYNFNVNTWYHAVVCSDGIKTYAYVNGTLIGDTITGYLPTSIEGNDICIGGATYYAGMQFFGRINDVRIYNHCLSLKEVKEIAKGLVLHYKLDNNGFGNPNLLINTLTPTTGSGATGITKSIGTDGEQIVVANTGNSNWVTFTNHDTTLTLTKGDTFTFSMKIKSPDSIKKPTVYFQSGLGYFNMSGTMSNKYSIIYYTGVWNIDNLTTKIHLGFSSAPGTYYIEYFKLEKGSVYTPWAPNVNDVQYSGLLSNNVYDESGYQNNGITNNVTLSVDTSRYNINTVFNNSYVKVDDNKWMAQNAPEMTINVWAKVTSSWPTTAHIFSCTEGGGFNTESGNTGYLRFSIYVCTNEAQTTFAYKFDSNEIKLSELPINQWVMLTFVYDRNGTRTYINGVLHHTYNNISYGIRFNTSARLFLGCEASGANPTSPYFNGELSDFRIYYTAFTIDQIQELYQIIASADRKGALWSYSQNENDMQRIYKTGVWEHKALIEADISGDSSVLPFPSTSAKTAISAEATYAQSFNEL